MTQTLTFYTLIAGVSWIVLDGEKPLTRLAWCIVIVALTALGYLAL